jgi:hypothetical protein
MLPARHIYRQTWLDRIIVTPPGFFFSPNYEWMIVGGWNPEGHRPFVDRKPRPGAFPPWELDPRPGLLLLKSGVNFPP